MNKTIYTNKYTGKRYKIPQNYFIHLNGFKYEVFRMQDEMFKVVIHIEKNYLDTEWLTIFKENATIFIEDGRLVVKLYLDFEEVKE
jgi:hypothetical protein